MTSYSSHSRGKKIDRSTSWSDYTWDPRGYWVANRYNQSGELEYDCRYPDTATQASQQIPRTPGDTNLERSLYQNDASSIGNASSSGQYGSYTVASTNSDIQLAVPSSCPQQPNSFSVAQSSYGTSHHQSEGFQKATTPLSTWSTTPSSNSTPGPVVFSRSSVPGAYATGQSSRDFKDMVVMTQGLALPSSDEQGFTEMSRSRQKYGGSIENPQSAQTFEQLDPRFKVIESKKLDRFWRVGRVFMMLWTEPARAHQETPHMGKTRNGSHFSVTFLNGQAFSEIRRFVVIRKNYGNCICSPIHTYKGQATLKTNLPDASEHAIIYTGSWPPNLHSLTDDDGNIIRENLHKDPVRVVREGSDEDQNLDEKSRLNYSKIYTVENYVRVLNIGIVHPNSMASLAENSCVRPSEYTSQSSRISASKSHSEPAERSQNDAKSDQGERNERGGKSKDEKKKKKDSSSNANSRPSGSSKKR